MPEFEYKVVPAPTKGAKAKGVKTPEARFANAIEILMNQMAAEGWEYQRADMLPSEERQGLTGSTTNWRNVLVFRREKPNSLGMFSPRRIDAAPETEEPATRKAPRKLELKSVRGPGKTPELVAAKSVDTKPNGNAGITAGLKARAAAAKSANSVDGA